MLNQKQQKEKLRTKSPVRKKVTTTVRRKANKNQQEMSKKEAPSLKKITCTEED